ncbi:hypothetical protein RJ639_024581 [Escallonia herrerae]|uniref:Serine protease n=1 Tax=Escallonia herrerae TaxID=1293975 RepID=A0AA89AD94_9ASTE|nr:hypothetical protein RJ639_024581 [Escallonia herrerae]
MLGFTTRSARGLSCSSIHSHRSIFVGSSSSSSFATRTLIPPKHPCYPVVPATAATGNHTYVKTTTSCLFFSSAAASRDNADSIVKTASEENGDVNNAYSAIELALDSVVKIFTVSSSPRFVIPGKRILTNAHVVADHTFVLVRKHGSPTKYRAEVQAVGHECDLAILVVESEEFWKGTNFLEFGDIPFLQEAVSVVGYPQVCFNVTERTANHLVAGGDNISVTKGVVSRVEPTQYVHGATQLLAIQIDAAINPGNSGGPAIMGNKVAGVAFQNLSGAENIGLVLYLVAYANARSSIKHIQLY